MAEFFQLNSNTEDKIISRQQRIVADTFIFGDGLDMSVTTKSTAPKLKIKFFLDLVRFYEEVDTVITDKYFKVGKYFELEHTEVGQHIFTNGFLSFTYSCTDNDGNGNFTLTITPSDTRYTLYVSSIVVEDSFYNYSNGWLNPDYSGNLINSLQTESWGSFGGYDFVYVNTGVADDTAIADLINNFFLNETAMTKYIKVIGDMGISGTINAINIYANNARNATCHIDFSDCNIPAYTGDNYFLNITGSTNKQNLHITGLTISDATYGISVNSANVTFEKCFVNSTNIAIAITRTGNVIFRDCYFNSGTNVMSMNSNFAGNVLIDNCTMIGVLYAISCTSTSNLSYIKVINSNLRSNTYTKAIYAVSGSLVYWFIMSNIFYNDTLEFNGNIIDSTTGLETNEIYIPLYSNHFSMDI